MCVHNCTSCLLSQGLGTCTATVKNDRNRVGGRGAFPCSRLGICIPLKQKQNLGFGPGGGCEWGMATAGIVSYRTVRFHIACWL